MNFLIIGPARSGTTSTRAAIDCHPDAFCHGEILAPNRVIGLSHHSSLGKLNPASLLARRQANLSGFLEEVMTSSRKRTGLKILYQQLFQVPIASAVEKFINDASIPIIFMWRYNLVERYLSEAKLRAQYAVRAKAPETIVVEVACDAMLEDCRSQIAMRRIVMKLFAGHPQIELVFEDIRDRKSLPEVNGLLDLGEPIVRLSDKKNDYISQTNAIVPNEDEIVAAYKAAEAELYGE